MNIKTVSTEKLKTELAELQAFLNDESSSVGRSDFLYEAALIAELQKRETCQKCGIIHDVEKASGHDLMEANTVAVCECSEHPDDEYCKQLLADNNGTAASPS